MGRTVADQVHDRVTALTDADRTLTRAAAIRAVADEMGRSVSATTSAFYARARRNAAGPPAAPAATTSGRRARVAGHAASPALYAEMLPLVEAGATVEQAARRFGDEDRVPEIVAGFARWAGRTQRAGTPTVTVELANARAAQLEAENGSLRREVAQARQAILEARAVLDAAADRG
jgi:hypothetical protein